MSVHTDESSLAVVAHNSPSLIDNINHDIKSFFHGNSDDYKNMDITDYRALVSQAQQALNDKNVAHDVIDNIYDDIIAYISEDEFFIQSNLYLRASRPMNHISKQEAIGWHRECWYGSPMMEKAVNIWTPISGVNAQSTLQYIPKSQHIADKDIILEQHNDDVTQKHDAGHKIGFLYAPKNIIAGVDLSIAKPMIVPKYHSALFSAHLIHGAGYNDGNDIRFSLDFRILPASAYCANEAKQYHFASNKPYFEKFSS